LSGIQDGISVAIKSAYIKCCTENTSRERAKNICRCDIISDCPGKSQNHQFFRNNKCTSAQCEVFCRCGPGTGIMDIRDQACKMRIKNNINKTIPINRAARRFVFLMHMATPPAINTVLMK
jgi:hypothetical protein